MTYPSKHDWMDPPHGREVASIKIHTRSQHASLGNVDTFRSSLRRMVDIDAEVSIVRDIADKESVSTLTSDYQEAPYYAVARN
jgi:hypothetical protein